MPEKDTYRRFEIHSTLASFHVKLVSCRQEQILNFSGQCVKLLGFLTLPITRLCLFLAAPLLTACAECQCRLSVPLAVTASHCSCSSSLAVPAQAGQARWTGPHPVHCPVRSAARLSCAALGAAAESNETTFGRGWGFTARCGAAESI